MFIVQHTIISDDIAHARFACHLTACKGACCVVGDAGAPVEKNEIAALNKAFKLLEKELTIKSREQIKESGLIKKGNDGGLELACVDNQECVFVINDDNGIALCAIQKAFYQGRINWEKPISCHLFPIRIMTIGAVDYLNFEFVPSICSPAVENAKASNQYLAEYLREPLVRKYGTEWYEEFIDACKYLRNQIAN
jgi:hypothetical protein